MPVAAIILAAGASRRLGRPKQLVKFDGESLLSRTIRLTHEGCASPVLAVLGAYSEVIRSTAHLGSAIIVHNDKWEEGIASSIHAGLHALDACAPEITGALLLSCDQPRLTAAHVNSLIEAFKTSDSTSIIASSYAGVDGVPAVFPRSAFAQLMALRGDQGARGLIRKPPCPVVSIAFAGGEIDIDSPDDLAQLS